MRKICCGNCKYYKMSLHGKELSIEEGIRILSLSNTKALDLTHECVFHDLDNMYPDETCKYFEKRRNN
jgi:predicted molibdopterin-dependent oxidoreductase YjgC